MGRTAEEAVNGYVTDMLALEEHIEKALRAQVKDFKDEYPEITGPLGQVHLKGLQRISALKGLIDDRNAGPAASVAEAVKRAGSIVAGLGAAAIDLIRNEKLPKDLRDDYVALQLASVGYVMLLTTARALEDARVADLAEHHLRECADSAITLNMIIPPAVVRFLREDELPARAEVVPEVMKAIADAWHTDTRELEQMGARR